MKISACMIVKNEAEVLANCLKSIHWADEIICVDTGSKDKTVEIAKQYGVKVFHHPWQDNFSLHRNQSISYASGDWFLIIDADEIISLGFDPRFIHDYLKKIPGDISALTCEIKEINNGDEVCSWMMAKLFRMDGFVRFDQIVHNEPIFKNKAAISEIKFHHSGYSLSPGKMKLKVNRTKDLLIKRIDNNPKDYVAHLYMVQTYLYQSDFKSAESHVSKYFKFSKKNKDSRHHPIAYFFTTLIWMKEEKYKDARRWCKKGLKHNPKDIDLNYLMAKICYSLDLKKRFKMFANRYFLELVRLKSNMPQKAMFFSANRFAKKEIMSLMP